MSWWYLLILLFEWWQSQFNEYFKNIHHFLLFFCLPHEENNKWHYLLTKWISNWLLNKYCKLSSETYTPSFTHFNKTSLVKIFAFLFSSMFNFFDMNTSDFTAFAARTTPHKIRANVFKRHFISLLLTLK